MSEPCKNCPCPDTCLRRESWCIVMGRKPDDFRMKRFICEQSDPDRKPTYPPLVTQAGNLLASAGRIISGAMRGRRVKASDEVRAERMAICLPCEFNRKRPDALRCIKCGCGPAKLMFAQERCPVGKWEAVTDQTTPAEPE